jgi:ActR/RegA family two-component response regulator
MAEIVASERPALPMDISGRQSESRPLESDVIDVLTIGNETTVFRPVQRALIGSGWVVRHADSVRSGVGLLQTNSAAVAVVEADAVWVDMLSSLRSLPNPPEVVVITHSSLAVEDVLSLGAHDLLRRPLTSADLLWSIATAWHAWMKQSEEQEGCG